jgi:CheY-like chemotaxis protein
MVDTRSLDGRRLLVVEDDYFIAAELVDTLEQLGVKVVGPAGSVRDALELLGSIAEVDGAVLDINLGQEYVFPVADVLFARAVPFVFVTGYDAIAIPEAYASAFRCEKPVDSNSLVQKLSSAGVR